MAVKVKVSQALTEDPAGMRLADVNGSTVKECLDELVIKQPNLKRLIYDSNGKLNEFIDIFINRSTAFPEPLSRPLKDGDELLIMCLIGGG